MTATTEPSSSLSGMTGPQKLATLLVILGGEAASHVLRHLSESEVEAVSAEMAKLKTISPEIRAEILREFGGVIAASASSIRVSSDFVQTALEKAVGTPKATSILNRVAPARMGTPSTTRVAELDAPVLANVLRTERAQTIALVLSCLPAKKASEVLLLLPDELREQAVERVATLDMTPVETLDRVVQVVLQKVGPQSVRPLSQPGGLKTTASILNALNREVSQPLLASLEGRNPTLVAALREKMFTFEDLGLLSNTALQRVMREIDLRELALALKSCSDATKNALLASISRRAAETVLEEMSFMGTVKARDVEAAQLRVVGIVRQLEADGEVELPIPAEQEGL